MTKIPMKREFRMPTGVVIYVEATEAKQFALNCAKIGLNDLNSDEARVSGDDKRSYLRRGDRSKAIRKIKF